MNAGNNRTRGLESVRAAQVSRKAGRTARLTPQVAALGLVLLGGSILTYRYVWSNKLESSRRALVGKQRATAVTVGKEWSNLAQELEKWTQDSAGAYAGDFRDPRLPSWKFQQLPGLWLRIRVADAGKSEDIQRAARFSVRDGFVSCFLGEAATPVRAEAATIAGEELNAGYPEQPWNVKRAYQATRVLEPAWLAEVQNATDDLRMRYFEGEFEKAERKEIPLTIDIIKKAQYFLLLLDEDVATAKAEDEAGLRVSDLTLVNHPVRVLLVDLKAHSVMLRVRTSAEGEYHMATESALSAESVAAMRRQVNNCSLAADVTRFMTTAK